MPTRRDLLAALFAAPLAAAAGRASAQGGALALTPECAEAAEPTPAQTEGPYFTQNSPERRDLAGDRPNGAALTLAGFVLDAACRPLPGALVEVWQADETGAYDNRGFALRGHQFADAEGRWWVDTVAPGLYPGRTRHIHVKVQRPGGRVLTTQLYFPGEPGNARDRIFDERLVVALTTRDGVRLGRFDFVLG